MFMSFSSTWGYLRAHEHTIRAARLQAGCWFAMLRWDWGQQHVVLHHKFSSTSYTMAGKSTIRELVRKLYQIPVELPSSLGVAAPELSCTRDFSNIGSLCDSFNFWNAFIIIAVLVTFPNVFYQRGKKKHCMPLENIIFHRYVIGT